MAYWDDEKSLTSSRPIELHAFVAGSSAWYYADGPANVVYGGQTYAAAYIRGERIEATANAVKARTKIVCDWDLPFASQYFACAPDGIVTYTRTRLQGTSGVTLFVGHVTAVEFRQRDRAGSRSCEIAADPFTGDLQTSGLTMRYERRCGTTIYSTLCGVSRAAYKVEGNLTGVDGLVLSATEFDVSDDGYWAGGDILVNSRRRKIVAHTGENIQIVSTIPGVAAGQAFDIAPGCDGARATCVAKFSNSNNFRGFPDIPAVNPFGEGGIL